MGVISIMDMVDILAMVDIMAVLAKMAMVKIMGTRHVFIFFIPKPKRGRAGSHSRSIRGPWLGRRSFA